MERERIQRHVASLEQLVRNTHLDLREKMAQFQEYSQRFTIESTVPPPGVITDFRRTYKGIHDQLTKIRGISQLLEGKYRPHYRRDSLRDREVSEFGFLAKNLYTRFESMLQAMEAKKTLKDKDEDSNMCKQHIPFHWFHSRDKQAILLRNLRDLHELKYRGGPYLEADQRPRIIQSNLRSLSLFILSGDEGLIDTLQSHMRLREHDIKERYSADELRGALTHLRQISFAEVEEVMKRFIDHGGIKSKCILFSIRSQKDLEKEIIGSVSNILEGMTSGEVRTLPI